MPSKYHYFKTPPSIRRSILCYAFFLLFSTHLNAGTICTSERISPPQPAGQISSISVIPGKPMQNDNLILNTTLQSSVISIIQHPTLQNSLISIIQHPTLQNSLISIIHHPTLQKEAMQNSLYVILFINLILLFIFLMAKMSLHYENEQFKLENIINKRTEELLNQKEEVDNLLSNMLPKETVNQLKRTGRARTRKYDLVSILFSDIEGFTRIAEHMNPEMLVDELDKFFFKFDSLVEEFNIEKIKTIGDAYMAAGGIPDANSTNPVEVVMAAIRIMQYMQQLKQDNEYFWDLRIGIHTGPVIAGVVGQKKLSYDIWGDSVNTASRMESSGESGKINISGSTYAYVKDFFACEYRGKMPVKYKGNIDMYFVKGFRPELSINMQGLDPNEQFYIKLQVLRMQDIEEEFIKKMETDLPATLHFHNQKYCIDLLTRCELLFNSENLSEEERLMVRCAALLDCLSYSKGYSKREEYINQIGREILPKYHFSEIQTDRITRLLNSPFLPPGAASLPEMILSDARLAFIGKTSFIDSANRLFSEMRSYGRASSREKFFDNLSVLLKSFKYYTITAQKLAEVSPENQIEILKVIKSQPYPGQMEF